MVQAELLVDVGLAAGFCIIKSNHDLISHAFVIVIEFAISNFTGSDARNAPGRFGMGGNVRNGEKGIAARLAFITDRNGSRVAAHVLVETTSLCGTSLDLWHDNFDMSHNRSPDSV